MGSDRALGDGASGDIDHPGDTEKDKIESAVPAPTKSESAPVDLEPKEKMNG